MASSKHSPDNLESALSALKGGLVLEQADRMRAAGYSPGQSNSAKPASEAPRENGAAEQTATVAAQPNETAPAQVAFPAARKALSNAARRRARKYSPKKRQGLASTKFADRSALAVPGPVEALLSTPRRSKGWKALAAMAGRSLPGMGGEAEIIRAANYLLRMTAAPRRLGQVEEDSVSQGFLWDAHELGFPSDHDKMRTPAVIDWALDGYDDRNWAMSGFHVESPPPWALMAS